MAAVRDPMASTLPDMPNGMAMVEPTPRQRA
jgi:hypothetical protein